MQCQIKKDVYGRWSCHVPFKTQFSAEEGLGPKCLLQTAFLIWHCLITIYNFWPCIAWQNEQNFSRLDLRDLVKYMYKAPSVSHLSLIHSNYQWWLKPNFPSNRLSQIQVHAGKLQECKIWSYLEAVCLSPWQITWKSEAKIHMLSLGP